jgi:hypothetical protein
MPAGGVLPLPALLHLRGRLLFGLFSRAGEVKQHNLGFLDCPRCGRDPAFVSPATGERLDGTDQQNGFLRHGPPFQLSDPPLNARAAVTASLMLVAIAGAAIAKDPFEEMDASAAQGNGYAVFRGAMYEGGHGVQKDYVEAARWYRLAADRGDAAAQLLLGVMYED